MTWFDLPALMGKRNRVISLNKADFLTKGNPVRLGGLLSSFAQEVSYYIAVADNASGDRLRFSQVSHQPGSRSAHFTFIAPDNIEDNEDIPALIDFLCYQAGEMGAMNVLADIEESHPLFEHFRRSGFCVFGWETIFRVPAKFRYEASESCWFRPTAVEEASLRSLNMTLVPPLVQNAEPFTDGSTPRLVYRAKGELQAYVESLSGSAGIYLVPVVHPSVEDIQTLLIDLVNHFQGMGRPLYVQVRSYQAWLAEHLLQLGAEATPRFALLVKHLAVGQLNAMREAQRSRASHRQAEPTAPIVNHYTNSSSHTDGVK